MVVLSFEFYFTSVCGVIVQWCMVQCTLSCMVHCWCMICILLQYDSNTSSDPFLVESLSCCKYSTSVFSKAAFLYFYHQQMIEMKRFCLSHWYRNTVACIKNIPVYTCSLRRFLRPANSDTNFIVFTLSNCC